jgi:hypothetical protein
VSTQLQLTNISVSIKSEELSNKSAVEESQNPDQTALKQGEYLPPLLIGKFQ